MKKLIVEVRINEYQSRDVNPHVPWTADEIGEDAARCREAGASIVHVHARGPDGAPEHGQKAYADLIRAIRARSDILVNPTLGFVEQDASAEQRLATVLALADDPETRPDIVPIDTGSVNVDWYDPAARRFDTKHLVYRNDTATLEYFAKTIVERGLGLNSVAWNVSFTRQFEALMDMGLIPEPASLLVLLSDGILLAGHPGTEAGLDAHTAFIPKGRRVEWFVCNFNGNLLGLTEKIIREGGHVSIGIGDYPYAEIGCPTNAELVRTVREQAAAIGREVATVDETRAMLGLDFHQGLSAGTHAGSGVPPQ